MLCSKVLDYHACCTHVQNSLLDFFLIVKSKLVCTPLGMNSVFSVHALQFV
jgi:hypothetical protein